MTPQQSLNTTRLCSLHAAWARTISTACVQKAGEYKIPSVEVGEMDRLRKRIEKLLSGGKVFQKSKRKRKVMRVYVRKKARSE